MFNIKKYIPPVFAIVLCFVANMIICGLGLDRIEHIHVTLEPKDETSIQYAVEEKHTAPVSSFLGLDTRMTYYVTYTDNNETKSALVKENIYHEITDTIYITSTTSFNPALAIILAITAAACIAVIIFAVRDLNLGEVLRKLISSKK